MRFTFVFLTLALLAVAPKPLIVVHPDDMMDSPRPKAPISAWSDATGRSRITLAVPGALLRGYRYAGSVRNGPVLLMFGGSGNLIERHDAAARGFARSASSVVWYDYRGYGFSGGVAHFDLLRSDALREFDAETKRAGGPQHVVVLGYSMGTAVADYVAINRSVGGLVLAAPWSDFIATSIYQDPKHRYSVTPHAASDVDEVAMVRKTRAPLLVFQGTKDDVIPPVQGPRLEAIAASPDKRFVPIVGAKHDGLLENAASQAAVRQFLGHLTNR